MDPPPVWEIDHHEIVLDVLLGSGTVRKVHKARWRGQLDVAVKCIELESISELNKLSQVKHNNIVQLYGACKKIPIYLVMEFADGGSLHDVLYSRPQIMFTKGHEMRWMKQCADAVNYLHKWTPRPVIHRNLKPMNLLLFEGRTVLKICDFGMATVLKTHMTKEKGTVQYMAPEVFIENHYTEKCDVYSFSIILWEVTSRQQPFKGLRDHDILTNVGMGIRPTLLTTDYHPESVRNVMTACWEQKPLRRPTMEMVSRDMMKLCNDFPGGEIPPTVGVLGE